MGAQKTRLILVANRLPISLQQTPEGLQYIPSPGGLAAALTPIRQKYRAHWIGWGGLDRALTTLELATLKLPRYLHPVNIASKTYRGYYTHTANGTLWPTMHDVTPTQLYNAADWQAMLTAAQQFVSTIAAVARPRDLIWVHDFQLIMLPHLLRQAGLKNRIGFFLHTPAPQASFFKAVPNYKEMLKSLLQADLLGVQTSRDISRLTGCFAHLGAQVRPPKLQHFPIGVHNQHFARASRKAAVQTFRRQIARQTAAKTVILSVSRLDYTKGIIRQMEAVAQLANQRGTSKGLLYKVIVSPSREDVLEYQGLKKDIDRTVARLSKRWPGLIDYEYRNFFFDELTAWYHRADVMLVVPTIDGMNLIAKEFVAVNSHDGVLVLSRHAGAAQQMQDAVLVDPHNTDDIVAGLSQALAMSPAEKHARFEHLLHNVTNQNVFWWADQFTQTLAA